MDTKKIFKVIQDELEKASSLSNVEIIETKYIGRKGIVTSEMKQLGSLPSDERKSKGKELNVLKNRLIELFETKKEQYIAEEIDKRLKQESIDITEPTFSVKMGNRHPLSIVQREVEDIFTRMGFMIYDSPEMESDYYNFEALNVPSFHPARDMQDTFWMKNGLLMRTQTSPGQIRSMLQYGAPIKLILPGRTFRYEATDSSHDHTFAQVEGLMVDKDISIANMNGIMQEFLKKLFKTDVKIRLRPGYFPFVEPGMELDMSCTLCNGEGCRVCSHTGWIEFMGCGMVHPNVLRAGGIDPDAYQGFAFGFGLTRLTMMKYKIPDIRLLLNPHYQFNIQF